MRVSKRVCNSLRWPQRIRQIEMIGLPALRRGYGLRGNEKSTGKEVDQRGRLAWAGAEEFDVMAGATFPNFDIDERNIRRPS